MSATTQDRSMFDLVGSKELSTATDDGSPTRRYNGTDDAAQPQPDPQPGSEVVLFHVIDDLKRRAASGYHKYGTFLETNNGRDALLDAYQESLDQCMYLKQMIMERGKFPMLVAVELAQARTEHAPSTSLHHYHSVLQEELDEFWEEVKKKPKVRSKLRLREELLQIAAMAQRCAEDLGLLE